jgi:copper transport protein
MTARPAPWARGAMLAAALLAAALVAGARAAPAEAHANLIRSDPSFGTSLQTAPRTIRLQFDEEVAADLSSVQLIGARTGSVGPLRPVAAGPDVLLVNLPPLKRDLYRLAWRTVAEDDLHATSGTVVFGVRTRAPAGAAGSSPSGASIGEVAVRWLDFALIALAVGALGIVLVVLEGAQQGEAALARSRHALLTLSGAGACFALVTGIGLLLVQSSRLDGGFSSVRHIVTGTSFGGYWTLRQALIAALMLLVAALRRSPSSRILRWASGLTAAAVTAPLAMTSHAAAVQGGRSFSVFLIAVHTLTACLWVGGVVGIAVACGLLMRSGDGNSARGVALAFGGYAATLVALLAISGLAVLGVHVRSLHALLHTAYGTAMELKIALFLLSGLAGLLVTLGLRRGRPAGLREAWRILPRFEAALLVAALAPAAFLTASAPARGVVAAAAAPQPSRTLQRAATSADLVFDVRLEPARPGINFITVGVFQTRRPVPAAVKGVTLRLLQPGSARSVPLVAAGPDSWRTTAYLRSGPAKLRLDVSRPGLADVPAAVPFRVPAAPTAIHPAQPSGPMEQPLGTVLRPVAAVGGLLLGLVMLVRAARRLASLGKRETAGRVRP